MSQHFDILPVIMNQTKTFTMISQGCRLNHAESAVIRQALNAKGLSEVGMEHDPDIVIVNTCTVTENGDKDTIRLVRKINRTCTQPAIALVGCQSQMQSQQLSDLQNVKWVIGNANKSQIAPIILNESKGIYVEKIASTPFSQGYSSFDPSHCRVNLKIQDGCDFYCSFCVIPFARGPARSRDWDDIMADAQGLCNMGVKEIVLTGINLGTYANQGHDFYDVLEALLRQSPSTRIRISSIEPTTVDTRLIELWQTYPNFCRYLHLPIQSGNDTILNKMRRRYTRSMYDDFITEIKRAVPNICIGTDVIVGFPGETDDLFEDTYQYLSRATIDYFHVFRYSERTMAHSRKFPNSVPSADIQSRSQRLRDLHTQKWQAFMKAQSNTIQTVLFEQKKKGVWVGKTQQFVPVYTTSDRSLKNTLHPVKLVYEPSTLQMIGELV
jgi:threonylcarbamoyladenosine tRNA methylthiotransferase MtaB